jgi:hypothetical protein
MKFNHPFLLRTPLDLPAGTVIKGVPGEANIRLVPVADVPPSKYGGEMSKVNSHTK